MKKRVREWFERGEHDLEAAELLLDRQAHADIVLFHLHQAVEKALKGFLLHHGWQLKKIHDLETLITEAVDSASTLEKYLDLARRLTAYYYAERYPPGPVPSYSSEETQRVLEAARQLIKEIRDSLTSRD